MADISEPHRATVLAAYRTARVAHPEAWRALPRVMREEWFGGQFPRAVLRLLYPQYRPFLRAWLEAVEHDEQRSAAQ